MPFLELRPISTVAVGPAAVVYTADAGGDATHTVDAALVEADDYWNNRYIKFITGNNAGLERLITDFVALTDTLTHDAFPNVVALGDTYIIGGWVNPTNAYVYDNTYTSATTNNAEQSYDYGGFLSGVEVIDKVFVKVKYNTVLAAVLGGDNATVTFSVKIYDGSTWTTYQVTALVYACTTINGESFSSTDGDNSNSIIAIDCTNVLNTLDKLNSAQTALHTAITVEAGLTLTVNVDCVSLLVCYHTNAEVFAGQAKTQRDNKSTREALKKLEQYLVS